MDRVMAWDAFALLMALVVLLGVREVMWGNGRKRK